MNNKSVGQVQRLDTGHPIYDSDRMKGKSTPVGNYGVKCCSHRFPNNEHQLHGVPIEQSVGKLTANSGKAKLGNGQANPDLARGVNLWASVETLHGLPQVGKEKVHSCRKLWGESASPAPTPAALGNYEWRCKNLPNSGNPKLQCTDTPRIGEVRKATELGYERTDRHDCLYTYVMCELCSRARWVRNQDLKTQKGKLCRSCSHTTTKVFRNHIDRVVESGAKRASELGKTVYGKYDPWYYPHLCSSCGKEIWHRCRDLNHVCMDCRYLVRKTRTGVAHPSWKGGRYLRPDGYYAVQIPKDSPYRAMAFDKNGYVLEHRLIVAQLLGRCLIDGEVIHHINRNKIDNQPDNLELLPSITAHLPYILLQVKVNKLESKLTKQHTEIQLLKWRVRELEHGNPELAGSESYRASVETLQEAPLNEDEEKVLPQEKS